MVRVFDVDRAEIERQLGELLTGGAHAHVAERLVRSFGPEIYGFLAAMMRDDAAADDVFSIFCEQIVRGLPGFEKKCSFRTWSYAIARNAAYQYRLSARRRGKRELGLEPGSSIAVAAAAVRTETARYLQTEVKSRFAALRDDLAEEDRRLLVLRVDKEMSFDDIARVELAESNADPDEASIKREAARLRKRFQLLKAKLVELAKREGLLRDE